MMNDQPSPPEPIKPDGDAPMINAINPDDLMGDFKGKPLFQILAVVLVLHVLVIGVFSYGYLKEQIVGEDTTELTDEQRMNLAVREATAAVRELAEKHGVNKQELANRFGDTGVGAAATVGDSDEPVVETDGLDPETPGGEPSDIERAISEEADGPTLPDLDDDISQEDPIFPE